MYKGGGNQPQASTFPRIRSGNWGVCVLEEKNWIASYMSGSKYKTWELAETRITWHYLSARMGWVDVSI